MRRNKEELREDAKNGWLDEHLPYELKMMRHSLNRMKQSGLFYLDWNAFHSAFGVAVANLAAFLTNAESGNNNFRATDFVDGFKARKKDLSAMFAKLEPQVFHLGQARPSNVGKFVLSDATETAKWVEEEIAKFIALLPDKSLWNDVRSQPASAPSISFMLSVGQITQTACTADPVPFSVTNAPAPQNPTAFNYKK